MPETEPQHGKNNLVRRIGERIGIIETSKQIEDKSQAFTEKL